MAIDQVEIVSEEFIKPISSTPHHLRTHKLSFLDMFIPSNIYVPMVFFYQNQETNIIPSNFEKSQKLLKQSLSETLVLFYPFAGRIKDRFSIDCNDEGAYYVEARVRRPLNEFLRLSDNLSFIPQLLPAQASWDAKNVEGYVAMIQVTTFACGSIVIGASLSHMIVDGPAAVTFLKSWAATTRKSCGEYGECPNFDASFVFPVPESKAYPEEATILGLVSPFLKKGICGSRRIVFDASKIALLRTKTSSSSVTNPTRVEVVSALLCKCIMDTFKRKSTLINHVVNIRRRAVPEVSENSMGNFLCMAASLVTGKETIELDNLVCHLRKAIRKAADGDFVKSLQVEGGLVKFCEYVKGIGNYKSSSSEMDLIVFSSWCKFGVYEIDFGWGKPAWVTCTASTNTETMFMNTIILVDTKMGDGIEVWVYLDEKELVMLEQNQELLAFGTLEQFPGLLEAKSN